MGEELQPPVITKIEDLYPDPIFKEMVEAGLYFGRKKSKTNPKMKPYVLTNRNGIEVVNLAKTAEVLEQAALFLRDKVRNGGIVLFVATQPPADGAIALAKEFGYPFVLRRWLGGTLTNYKIISKRIEYYKKLKSESGTSALDKYTKKERLMIEKELVRLTELMGGIEPLTGMPAVMVVIDPNLHTTAVREARILKIPVIALANTDSDPDMVQFPVVGNNKSRMSINWFLGKLKVAIEEGKTLGPEKPVIETKEEATKEKKEVKAATAKA
jgi:small subunit ribosomal protein S2